MRICEAVPDDASNIIALLQRLYSETPFLLFEPGEMVPDVAVFAQRIAESAQQEAGAMFVAEMHGELVGVIFGNRGAARKTRHSMFLVMGVLQAFTGRGVGSALMSAVEAWALARELHRLELNVSTANVGAIALYEKTGFRREGVKRHSLKLAGSYVDEFVMSKLIAA